MRARTAEEYARVLLALLPRGRIWPREAGSTVATVVSGLSPTPARLDARALELLTDAFPPTALELLPEWERSLGLPDPCSGAATTIQGRRAQVVARLIAVGGQSVPYFIAYAATLGFTVTVEEFAPARAGVLRAGDALLGEAWAHTWRIHAPAETVTYFRAGLSAAGEPLAAWGNAVLGCVLQRVKPAHTILQIAYGS